MALSTKAMLIGGGAAGALLLLLKRGTSAPSAPLPAGALARPQPPAPAGTPVVQQVAGDVGSVLTVVQQGKSLFDSLPSWGSTDGTPALGADDPASFGP